MKACTNCKANITITYLKKNTDSNSTTTILFTDIDDNFRKN